MNYDFTRNKYRELLVNLQAAGYCFITFADYCKGVRPKTFVILRHDVDLRPYHSLATAIIENELGLNASYYFRAIPQSWDESIIKKIYAMGHEVGYHYESLSTCNGNIKNAYEDFKMNLERLRKLVPVSTICMHGSPRSSYDSKDIWKIHSYRDLDLIGEPYFDTDFSQVFYLTDTGRCWDGHKVSVRDRIPTYQDEWIAKGWVYHTTDEVIQAVHSKTLPLQLMITTHPQRWSENLCGWLSEYLMQNIKNVMKRILIKYNNL